MAHRPAVTEQATPGGRAIEQDSLALVDAEAGDRSAYTAEQWAVVRRMIHATADFDLNGITRFADGAVEAGLAAVRAGAPLWTDVEMIRAGISAARRDHFGMAVACTLNEPEVPGRAARLGTTRAEQAVAVAAEQGLLEGIVAIGNAPTALRAVLARAAAGEIAPRLVLAMPVGFVAAAESKEEAMAAAVPPWIATRGRKGGSPCAVAAIHALMHLAAPTEAAS